MLQTIKNMQKDKVQENYKVIETVNIRRETLKLFPARFIVCKRPSKIFNVCWYNI